MAKNRVIIKRIDRGKRRALRLLRQPRNTLWVGVMEPDVARTPSHYNGATIGEVAHWMEYGTMNSPARSWLRDWIDINSRKVAEQLAGDTLRVVFDGEDERGALERRGVQYSNSIRGRINRRIPPPNRPATLRRKRGNTPLIDLGLFKKAITYKVT